VTDASSTSGRPHWRETATIDWYGGAVLLGTGRVLLAGATSMGARRYACNSVMLRDIENGSECGSVMALVSELEMVQTAIATEVFATERAAVLEHGDRVGERDGLLVISLGDDTVRITCAELERAIEIGRLGEEIGFTYPLVLSDGELITVSFADLFAEQGEQGLAFVRAITGGRLTGSLPATLQEWRALAAGSSPAGITTQDDGQRRRYTSTWGAITLSAGELAAALATMAGGRIARGPGK